MVPRLRPPPPDPAAAARDNPDEPLRELAFRARAGDREAARLLLLGIAPAVRAVVRRMSDSRRDDTEDLVQESLLGFVRALEAFRGECSVLHYARRITVWRVLEEHKRTQSQKRRVELDRSSEEREEREDSWAQAPSCEVAAVGARQRARLQELLHTLRSEQAEVLALRHVLDYTVEEIAEVTRVPANTVRSRLRLAKEALRARIESDPLLGELDLRQA
jgi:RNA polymerase sigma-70 factor (ECF subfamily)